MDNSQSGNVSPVARADTDTTRELRDAIADTILLQAKKRLKDKTNVDSVVSQREQSENTILHAKSVIITDANRNTKIIEAQYAARQAVVNSINKELLGNSNFAEVRGFKDPREEIEQELGKLYNNEDDSAAKCLEWKKQHGLVYRDGGDTARPMALHELYKLLYLLKFQNALRTKSLAAKSASDVREEGKILAKQFHAEYLEALRLVIRQHHRDANSVEKLSDEVELREKLANVIKEYNKDDEALQKKTNENVIAEQIKKEKDETKHLKNQQDWIERSIHQAKLFALSCGTTMAGAVLLYLNKIDPSLMIAGTFISPFFVLAVTKANWWLVARPIAEIFNEMVRFFKLSPSEKNKELEKYHKGKLLAMFLTSIGAAFVWSVLTYAATRELLFEMGAVFGTLPGISALGTGIFFLLLFAVKGFRDFCLALNPNEEIKARTNARLIHGVRGLALMLSSSLIISALALGNPALATTVLAYAFSGILGLYTFPTIFAVFLHVGKKFANNEIDAKSRVGNDHNNYEKLKETLNKNTDLLSTAEVDKRYKIFAIMGIFVMTAFCFMFAPFIAKEALGNSVFGISNKLAVHAIVSAGLMAISGVCLLIYNWHINMTATHHGKSYKNLNGALSDKSEKAYAALKILLFAVVWGGITTLLASAPSFAWTFGEMGLGSTNAEILSYVAVLAMGGVSAVWFYWSSAIGSIFKAFGKEDLHGDTDGLAEDPIGLDHGPNFKEAIDLESNNHRTWGEYFADGLKWVKDMVWPFTNDKKSFFKTFVVINGALNAAPSAYGGYSAFSNVSDKIFFGAGNSAYAFAGGSAGSIAANINGGIEPAPSVQEQLRLTKEMYTTLVSHNIAALAVLFGIYKTEREKNTNEYSGSSCFDFAWKYLCYSKTVKLAAAEHMQVLLSDIAGQSEQDMNDKESRKALLNKHFDFSNSPSTATGKLNLSEWKAANQGRMADILADARTNETVKGYLEDVEESFKQGFAVSR